MCVCVCVCVVCTYSVYAFCPICALFHMLYMSKDIAKLATLESQKEAVCTTHLRNLKKRKAIKGVETNATGIVTLLKALVSITLRLART